MMDIPEYICGKCGKQAHFDSMVVYARKDKPIKQYSLYFCPDCDVSYSGFWFWKRRHLVYHRIERFVTKEMMEQKNESRKDKS